MKIDFEMSDPDNLHIYKDALYLEDDNTFTEEEIQKMKQDRFDKWLSIILGNNTDYIPINTPTEI